MDSLQEQTREDFVDLYSSSIIVFNVRFSHYIGKISASLSDIKNRLQMPYGPEYEEQVIKREIKMAAEFGRRFWRINLYSIQLKLKKLEKEIVLFRSPDCCKVAKAFTLRLLVLSVFKYMFNSIQVYLKFINKCKIRVFVKLQELLNYVSHSYEIISYIVDHRSLEIHDLSRICSSISDILQNQKFNLKATSVNSNQAASIGVPALKRGVIKMRAKSNRKKVDVPKKLDKNIGEASVTVSKSDVRSEIRSKKELCSDSVVFQRPKNIRFEMCTAGNDDETENAIPLHHRTRENVRTKFCITVEKVCEAVLKDLTADMVDDISQCIHDLALETFSREFSNSK